jgi:ectoine hydroxylase-related dioxygenase (phytanoyl-CoA dioxygenase family)
MSNRWRSEIDGCGYCVIRNVVSTPLRQNVLDAIERRRLQLQTRNVPSLDDVYKSAFFPLWNNSALWRIRELAAVRSPFEVIYETSDLWVSLDRCGYRLPGTGFLGGLPLHWDDDATRWDFAMIQGIIAVTPSKRNNGEFVCAPDLYRIRKEKGRKGAEQSLIAKRYKIVSVELNAGDLLLFDYRLPHGTGSHVGHELRVVQYLSFVPEGNEAERATRLRCWRDGEWRGDKKHAAYAISDEREPALSLSGVKALLGNGGWENASEMVRLNC